MQVQDVDAGARRRCKYRMKMQKFPRAEQESVQITSPLRSSETHFAYACLRPPGFARFPQTTTRRYALPVRC
eukprot:2235109-Prorocentrum_lima.AAC.1